jgi:hypothetical protein
MPPVTFRISCALLFGQPPGVVRAVYCLASAMGVLRRKTTAAYDLISVFHGTRMNTEDADQNFFKSAFFSACPRPYRCYRITG